MSAADPFAAIRAALAASDRRQGDHGPDRSLPAGRPQLVEAGVLVPLIRRGAGLSVVLTRRSAGLKHHAGQNSFPGGRLEPEDCGPQSAALREAREEIGLDPALVEVLGQCSVHETSTGFRITPFVGAIRQDVSFVPQAGEVEDVFEVPFGYVTDPGNYGLEHRHWRGARHSYYAITCGPHYIWGATAGILHGLARRISGSCE